MALRSGSPKPVTVGLSWLPTVGNAIADLLFPPHCVACRHLGAWLCDKCLAAVQRIRPPVCEHCGLPLAGGRATCTRCQAGPGLLDGLRSFAFHADPLRQAIHEFKYEGLRSLAAPLGQWMAQAWPDLAGGSAIDCLVPVPLHAARERERGYNQSALLAQKLGQVLNKPVAPRALVRTRATRPQVGLTAGERRANVAGAFRCQATDLAGKQVLLVDDVLTTGATLAEAAAALRACGVASVWAYTLARAMSAFSVNPP